MADSLLGNIIEFLIGLIILPRLVTLIWMFAVPILGLSANAALIAYLIFSVILLVITFFIRKVVAIGFLIGTIWDIITTYFILF